MKLIGLAVLVISVLLFSSVFGSGLLFSENDRMADQIEYMQAQEAGMQGEPASASARLEEGDGVIASYEERLRSLGQERERLQTDLDQSQGRIDELDERIIELNNEMEALRTENTSLENELEESQAEAQRLGLLVSDLEDKLESARQEKEQVEGEKRAAQSQVAALNARIEEIEASPEYRLAIFLRQMFSGWNLVLLAVGTPLALLGAYLVHRWTSRRGKPRPPQPAHGSSVSQQKASPHPENRAGSQQVRKNRKRVSKVNGKHADPWDDLHFRRAQRELARYKEGHARWQVQKKPPTHHNPGSLSGADLQDLPHAE